MGREKIREGGERRGIRLRQEGWGRGYGRELGASHPGAKLGAVDLGAELGTRVTGAELVF